MNFLITRKLGHITAREKPFKFIQDSFVSGAEIMLSRPELIDKADINELRQKCDGLKLTAHLPFYDLNLASVDPFICDYSLRMMKKGIDLCREMNIKTAVAHLGFNVKLAGKAAEKWKETFFKQKRIIEFYAHSAGVIIVWENTYEENFELFDEMLRIDPETLFCLDIGHCNCFAGFSAIEFFERYRKNIVHLHIHDNYGHEDSHLAPGRGNINFSKVLDIVDSRVENAVIEVDSDRFIESEDLISKILKAEEK